LPSLLLRLSYLLLGARTVDIGWSN
jgi:hypothetical protein